MVNEIDLLWTPKPANLLHPRDKHVGVGRRFRLGSSHAIFFTDPGKPDGVELCRTPGGTGRAHQIRVQLAARGLPIVGDVKYGARPAQPGQIALHAAELAFDHPVRHERTCVRAPVPADWARSFGLT